jgi:hypothetical protein
MSAIMASAEIASQSDKPLPRWSANEPAVARKFGKDGPTGLRPHIPNG